jgi:hypothetical protein
MLKKDSIIKRYKEQENLINEKSVIPALDFEDISASFIKADGTVEDMKDESEHYLNADKIVEISFKINEDTNTLSDLSNDLLWQGAQTDA